MAKDKKKQEKKSNLSQSTIHQYVSSTPQRELRNKHGISHDTSGRTNKRDSLSSTGSPSIVSCTEKRKSNEEHKTKVSKKQKINSDKEINLTKNTNSSREISAVSPVKSKNKKTLKSQQPSVDIVSKSSVKEKFVNTTSPKRKNESIANVFSPDENVKHDKKKNTKFTNSNDKNHKLNVQPMEVSSSPSKNVQHNKRSTVSKDTSLNKIDDRLDQKVSNSKQQKVVSSTESSHSEDSSSDEMSHDEQQVAPKKKDATAFVRQEDISDEEVEGDEETVKYQFNEDEKPRDGDDWNHSQTNELILLMKDQMEVDPKDKWTFRKRVKRLNWGAVPSSLHPPRTQEECETRLQQIIGSVLTTRNLYEMLSAYRYKKAGTRVLIMAPLQRFCKDNSTEIKQKGGNFFQTAKAMYEALTEEERKSKYIDPYEMEKLNTKQPVVAPSHSGLFFYCERHAGTDKKLLKQQYDQLKPGKKIKYIRKAVEDYRRAVSEHKEIQSTSKNVTVKPPLNHITKPDWKLLLRAEGMPTLAYTTPLQIFNEKKEQEVNSESEGDLLSDGNNKNNLKRYFSFQRSARFEECKATYLKLIDEYSREYHTWLPTLNDPLLQQQAALFYKEVMASAEKAPKKKTTVSAARRRPAKTPNSSRSIITKQIADKVQQLENSSVEVTMTGSFFKHEPKRPPMTAKEFFISYVKSKMNVKSPMNQSAVNISTMYGSYQKLSAQEKSQCEKKAQMGVIKYKADLKKFVNELDEHERKVYIGQNRIKFIRIFEGTDIFEKEFPCKKYPPFKKVVRQKEGGSGSEVEDIDFDINQILTDVAASPKKKIKTDVEGSHESQSEEEEEDDDEEVSEDDENNEPDIKVNGRKMTAVSEEAFKKMMKSTSTPEVHGKKGNDSESEENEEEQNETMLVQMGKKLHAKELVEQSDDSTSDEETSEEEEKAVVQPTSPSKRFSLSTVKSSRGLAKQNSGSGALEESSSSSEEEDDNQNKIPVRSTKLSQPQKVEEDSDESEEDINSAWM